MNWIFGTWDQATNDAGTGSIQELHHQAPRRCFVDLWLTAALPKDAVKGKVVKAAVLHHCENLGISRATAVSLLRVTYWMESREAKGLDFVTSSSD